MPSGGKWESKSTKAVDKKQDKRISKLEKQVAQVEKKYQEFSTYNNSDGDDIEVVSGATIRRFNNISNGSEPTQRVGQQINIKSLKYKAAVSNVDAAPALVRFMPFRWLGDGIPLLGDVLNINAPATGVPDPIMTKPNQTNIANGYLKVYKDEYAYLEGVTVANGTRQHVFTFNKNYKIGPKQTYRDTAGSDISSGLYFLLCQDNATVPTSYVRDSCITVFTDL